MTLRQAKQQQQQQQLTEREKNYLVLNRYRIFSPIYNVLFYVMILAF